MPSVFAGRSEPGSARYSGYGWTSNKVISPSPLSRNSKRLIKSWYSNLGQKLAMQKPTKTCTNIPTDIFTVHVIRAWELIAFRAAGKPGAESTEAEAELVKLHCGK